MTVTMKLEEYEELKSASSVESRHTLKMVLGLPDGWRIEHSQGWRVYDQYRSQVAAANDLLTALVEAGLNKCCF